jgi:hypothetical protein
MGRNPVTGAVVQIAASKKVAFRAATEACYLGIAVQFQTRVEVVR